jgi:cyclopropane-fatty-acyl-phospholipid synthase
MINNSMALHDAGSIANDTRVVFSLLKKLQGGLLAVSMPDGSCHIFGEGSESVSLVVHDEALFTQVLARGDIGLAEAYLDGLWDSSDIAGFLTLLAANRDVLKQAVYGSWRQLLRARVRHWLNRNSRAGSKRNIMSHYDLGNAFYQLWLDDSMSYSSALYQTADTPLAAAQENKYQRIIERLNATAGSRILEIGCGWGGFAEVARKHGMALTGLTLSPAQLAYAKARVPEADLRLQDYRDTKEQFDHVVSIEMFEAVGERWWPSYFKTIAKRMLPGGRAVIQTITIRDDLFARYRKGTDFIQQYVFPGGMLPSRTAFEAAAAKQGLRVQNAYAFGQDYAKTLAQWRINFDNRWPEIAALGFDEHFRRLWCMYLGYCEAGFRTGNIDVVQFELTHS